MITPNKTLRILFASNAVFVLAGGLLAPLFALFIQGVGGGIMAVSLSSAVFLISTTIFMFLFSRVLDKDVVKKHRLVAGYFLRAIVWFLYAFVPSLPFLLILQFFLGLGEALGTPSFGAIFAEHLDNGKHVAEFSEWQLLSNGAGAVAAFLGGIIVTSFGFTPLFYLMACLAIFSGILLSFSSYGQSAQV